MGLVFVLELESRRWAHKLIYWFGVFVLEVTIFPLCLWVLTVSKQTLEFLCFSFGSVLIVGEVTNWLCRAAKMSLSFQV